MPNSNIASTPPSTRLTPRLFHLISHPRAKGLSGESVLVFAEVVFVNREWKNEDAGENEILQPVHERMYWLEASDTFRQIPHVGRPTQIQQQQRDDNSIEEIPENQPVTAFEIGVRAGCLVGGNLRHISVGGSRPR